MEQRMRADLAPSYFCLAAQPGHWCRSPTSAPEEPFGCSGEFMSSWFRLEFRLRRGCSSPTLPSAPSSPQAVIGCFGLMCRKTQRGTMHAGKQRQVPVMDVMSSFCFGLESTEWHPDYMITWGLLLWCVICTTWFNHLFLLVRKNKVILEHKSCDKVILW